MRDATLPLGPSADVWLAVACCGALGLAGVLALAGVASGSLVPTVAAAGLGATGLGILMAAGWIELLPVVLVTLPLPALYATESARISPVLPVSALAVGAWLLGGGRLAARGREARAPLRAILVLFGAVALAGLFAQARLAAAREVVNFALLAGLFLTAYDQVARRPERARALVRGLALVSALAGLAAVLEAVGLIPPRFPLADSTLARAAGGFGWPNELGMFFAITLPFALHEAREATSGIARAAGFAAAALVGVGLAATFSRGSWLAVAAAPAVLPLVGEGRSALRFWVGVVLAVVALDLASGGALSERVTSTTGDVLVAQRLLLMSAGLLMFRSSPVVGVGPGGFGDALDRFGLQVSGLFDFVGSAHNGYIHMAAETGALGLAALLWFLASTGRTLARGLRRPPGRGAADPVRSLGVTLLWSFATACLVALSEWPFAHGVGELIALVAGAGVALAARREAPR